MKNLNAALLVASCIASSLVGCAEGMRIPQQQVKKEAPKSQDEVGYIVMNVSESKLAEIALKNPQSQIRIVNKPHNLFEVFGLDYAELKDLIADSNVIIEKNQFIETIKLDPRRRLSKSLLQQAIQESTKPSNLNLEKHPLVEVIEQIHNVPLQGDLLKYVNSCKLNEYYAPNLLVENNQGRDRFDASIYYEVGENLQLSAKQSSSKNKTKLSFLWIVTTPEDSMLGPIATGKAEFDYLADATGTYVYSLVAKDGLGYCNITADVFFVTSNEAFQPVDPMPDSMSEKIDTNTFWHILHVGSHAAWTKSTGEGVTIGIIDSGVNYNHPALASNIYKNKSEIPGNGVDDDNNGFIDDYTGYDFGENDSTPFDDEGHGSHVAGIAASNVFGAARKALIMPVKYGAGLGMDLASVSGAIRYTVDQGAKILNMSFGGPKDFAALRTSIDYAEKNNVLVVAAAGNDRVNNNIVESFPANYENANLISVAATGENNKLTKYSNFGKKRVMIAAPGGTAAKPIISSFKRNPSNSQFIGLAGTSMATPLVAGVAAQVWSANPNLTAVQVKKILLKTGKKSKALKGRIRSGKVVNAMAAVKAALATRPQSSKKP